MLHIDPDQPSSHKHEAEQEESKEVQTDAADPVKTFVKMHEPWLEQSAPQVFAVSTPTALEPEEVPVSAEGSTRKADGTQRLLLSPS